jgi:secernin
MCDTLCAFQPDRTLFAKSSDRPPREPQLIEAHPARAGGSSLRTQYLSLGDDGAPALIGSRPDWLWGFEHGINEHRLAVGNEQLWTVDDPTSVPEALTGMDLVRLALERGHSAEQALDVVVSLVERLGQGGVGDRDAGKAYFSSFLFADPVEAWVLETSDRSWAARRIDPREGGVSLSNRISLSTDWGRASTDVAEAGDFDRWRRASSPTSHADKRLAVTRCAADAAAAADDASAGARELAASLRDHDAATWGWPGSAAEDVAALPPAVIDRLGTGVSVCMHLTEVQATTSSMIASLPRSAEEPLRGWFAPGNPCVTVFVPTFGLDGLAPELAEAATWHRFEALRDQVEQARMADPGGRGAECLREVRSVLAPVEAELWDEADSLVERAPHEQVAWAHGLWPRVDAALHLLGT